MSPKSVIEFPLPSTTAAVLFTVSAGDLIIGVSVGSFSVFPSSSSPLSLISEISLVVLKQYESPVNLNSDQIAIIALDMVRDYSLTLTQVYYALQEQRQLSLGMDDFLASAAGKFDKFEYLLSQRIKKGY